MRLADYKKKSEEWEVLINFDNLTKSMGKKIVFKKATLCRQKPNRYFITMTFGNKDEAFVKEWDLSSKKFIEDGFSVKRSNGSYIEDKLIQVAWLNANMVLITFSKSPSQDRNSSGYPKDLYLWQRGEPIEKAKKIYSLSEDENRIILRNTLADEQESSDVFFSIWKDFYNHKTFSIDSSQQIRKVDLPSDCQFLEDFSQYKFIRLRSDWTISNQTYKKGAVLSLPLKSFYVGDDQKKDITIIFDPKPHLAFYGIVSTKNEVLMTQLNHVKPEILRVARGDHSWTSLEKIPFNADIGKIYITSSIKDATAILNFESFICPPTFYTWNGKHHKFAFMGNTESFPSGDYITEQRFATSQDGTKIPYFLTYKKGMHFNSNNPTILSAYGGFQISKLPFYSRALANVWLKNGGVYVTANIRGGGEYGVAWHESARKNKRQTGFDDFLSVAEALIYTNVTNPQHLGIQGGSNGGLLVTVAMTQRPDLFRSVVSNVPILDMERYTEFGAGPSWIEEYGNPLDPEMRAYLKNYTPLRNIFPHKNYPTLLLTTSSQDQRVHPWHGRIMKWMMDHHPNAKTYYIEEQNAGHGSGSDLTEIIVAISREYTFFADTLGLTIKKVKGQPNIYN